MVNPNLPILLLATAGLVHGQADPAAARQAAAVKGFYRAVIATRAGGVPGGQELARLRPFISRRLQALLVAANEAEALYARKTRNTVPPLVEGCLFTSLFEGPEQLVGCSRDRAAPGVAWLVELDYGTLSGIERPVRWKDRVILARSGGRWVIDDIEALGDWAFGTKGRLTDRLNQVLRDAEAAEPE